MFPLFYLPVVAIIKVFELTLPQELTVLSFCSKKCRTLVKSLRRKTPKMDTAMVAGFSLRVDFLKDEQRFIMMRAMLKQDEPDLPLEHISIDNHLVPVKIEDDGCIRTFWNDRETGLKCIMEYLTDLFKSDVTKLVMADNNSWPIDYLKNYHLKRTMTSLLKMVYVEIKEIDDNLFMDMLTTLTVSDWYLITGYPSQNFRYSGSFKPFNKFRVFHSFWVSIENLISLDCKMILLLKSKIQSAEMNRFLKNWVCGGSARLKLFNIEMEVIDLEVILSDLTVDRIDLNVIRRHEYTGYDAIKFQGGFDIKNENGVTGTVVTDWKTTLYFLVWPDSTGNVGAL